MSFRERQQRFWGLPCFWLIGYCSVTLGTKLPRREADRSFPSYVESSYKPSGSMKRRLQHHSCHFKAIKYSRFAIRYFVFTLRSPWRFGFVILPIGFQLHFPLGWGSLPLFVELNIRLAGEVAWLATLNCTSSFSWCWPLQCSFYIFYFLHTEQPRGLVVRVSGY
jgi:hypothetical protein